VAAEPSQSRPVGRPPRDVPQGEATRHRIQRVAVGLFAKQGYDGTGVAEIGRVAGVRQGALYYHIGSKEELLFQVLKAHVEESLQGEQAIVASDLDPAEKLRKLLTHHVATIAKRRAEVVVYLRDQDKLTGERARSLQRLRNEVESLWWRVFREGAEAGVFRPVDRVEVNGLLGMVNFVFYWYRADGQLGPEDIAERFYTLTLHGIHQPP